VGAHVGPSDHGHAVVDRPALMRANGTPTHTVAVVVPVYRGEETLPALLEELDALVTMQVSAGGNPFRVSEVVLVHDCGPDRSDVTIRALAARYPYVRPVWLARNFGQHAATLGGMSSTSADWIVTLDEDGQHNPEAIGGMLDVALSTRSPLVYAKPTNKPPHSAFRNLSSRAAHAFARLMGASDVGHFHSFRLILGETGRGLAAYCGESVYLDVALTWVVNRKAVYPVEMREERGHGSGYSLRHLVSHWWRMTLTAGTRPLRLVALLGALLGVGAVLLTAWVVWNRLTSQIPVQGWTSITVILLVTSGATLFSLGILAEYLGVAARTAMGKPINLVVSDPAEGPLGRAPLTATAAQSESADQPQPAEPAATIEA
jgi:glycosyltransferase involved in cell wall biosynthesis